MREIMKSKEEIVPAVDEIGKSKETDDSFEKQLYHDFGWDPQKFRKVMNEYYLEEFYVRENKELLKEQEIYDDPEKYHFSALTGSIEGPNCLAFAMKWALNPLTGQCFDTRPLIGEFTYGDNAYLELEQLLESGTPEELKDYMSSKLKDDGRLCGLDIKEVDKDYKVKDGEWLIAMVATDHTVTLPGLGDFHFYRRGEEGVWYHKPGMADVTDRDGQGELIYDPALCNRGNYDLFLGYYAVKRVKEGAKTV